MQINCQGSTYIEKELDCGFILLIVVLILFKKNIVKESFKVLLGKKTWVGYNLSDKKILYLPGLKKGVYQVSVIENDDELVHFANIQYARFYSLFTDLEIVLKSLFQ